jgi:hypothetical protein
MSAKKGISNKGICVNGTAKEGGREGKKRDHKINEINTGKRAPHHT